MYRQCSFLTTLLFVFLVVVVPTISAKHQLREEIASVGISTEGEQREEFDSAPTGKRKDPIIRRKKERARVGQSDAAGIKIKNPRNYGVDYYWWSGTNAVYQGKIHARGVTATNSYIGHTFLFTKEMIPHPSNPLDHAFATIKVETNVNLYILPPEIGQENDLLYLKMMEEKRFTEDYLQRTGFVFVFVFCFLLLSLHKSF